VATLVKVLAKNSVLSGTRLHLNKTQLCHCIKSEMDTKLTLCCHLEKIGSEGMLAEWLDDMSHVDDLLHTKHTNFDVLAKSSCENSRHNNTFAEPSHCANTNTSTTNHVALPKLTAMKCQLLYDNNGCLKCRHIFVPHCSTDCPNDFLDAVNYKPLTQFFIKLIKKHVKKSVAIMASSSNDDDTPTFSAPALVAMVMGMMSNPTAYTTTNLMSVIEGDSFSDKSVSPLCSELIVQSVLLITHASSVLTAQHEDLAPKPPQLKPALKKKLKKFFCDLQENCKIMIAELKMVCVEHKCQFKYRPEPVKPIDKVGACQGSGCQKMVE